jgi:hypothetical protein
MTLVPAPTLRAGTAAWMAPQAASVVAVSAVRRKRRKWHFIKGDG